MEKIQIAKYGLMQVVAIVYGMLVCGASVKFNRNFAEQGYSMPDAYYLAMFVRDYGYVFFMLAISWVALVAYATSGTAGWNVNEDYLLLSGLFLGIAFAFAATVVAVVGAASPMQSYMPAAS